MCNEWVIYPNIDKLIAEIPVFIDKSKLKYDEEDLNKGKSDGDTTIYYPQPKQIFTCGAVCKNTETCKTNQQSHNNNK